jgi:hypothetical protein
MMVYVAQERQMIELKSAYQVEYERETKKMLDDIDLRVLEPVK